MSFTLSRRAFLTAGSSLLIPRPAMSQAQSNAASPPIADTFPTQPPDLAREMVGVSHGNIARVRELLARHKTLALATWDWGFGDWESALGAASHVGNREIAELLLANGARPSIFSAAMLGQLDVVKAFIATAPGVQRIHGPHSITLLAHARAGGEAAKAVVSYLESVGDADSRAPTQPVTPEDMALLSGTYMYGPGATEAMLFDADKAGLPGLTRTGTSRRVLRYLGNREFYPVGAEAVRIRFVVENGRAVALTIHDPDLVVTAKRTS